MSGNPHFRFWLGTFVVFGILLWLLSGTLTPFVLGAGIAYLLDPLADRLEGWGMRRWVAAAMILGGFFLILALALILLFPLLQDQVVQFISRFPEYLRTLEATLRPWLERLQARLPEGAIQNIGDAAGASSGKAVEFAGNILKNLWSGGLAVVDLLSLILITPLVAFYMLRDWVRMLASIDDMLPRRHAETIRQQARASDEIIAGFIRGQSLVCLLLGIFYAVGLTLAGLHFGLLIGFATGLLSFVPFIGVMLGCVVGLATAFVQFDEWSRIALVAGIFALGQFIEGNFITPKLVGERVGLHPVWVIFALLAGGTLFGFTGVMLAVPVTAVVGVLVRFALGRYKASDYYRGPAD